MVIEVGGTVPPVVVRTWHDGRIDILDAPAVAEFSTDILGQLDPTIAIVNLAGHLELGGQVTYRPIAFRQDPAGRVTLICQKV